MLAKNSSDQLVDINVLYVGSDYSITHIVAERLAPQATLEEGLLAFTDTSFGMVGRMKAPQGPKQRSLLCSG